jgi:branched-chain amino acid transport system permease protein
MGRPAALDPGSWSLSGWVTALALAVLALLPGAAELLDQPFLIDLVNRLMILAIAAVSLNLILGYGGMISFGHAAYLGIGAYAVGIPAYYDFYSAWLHIPLAVAVSALFALVTGAICLRTRGVYFIMITMAFSQMMYFLLVSLEEYGGDDGLVINARSEIGGLIDLENHTTLYYATFVLLAGVLYLVHRVVNSRFGLALQGAKGNEPRMQAIGFDTWRYRLACYVLSGAICGLAGALLGNFTSFISPEMMDWRRSGELIFMVVLGGTGSLFGPVLGAAAFLLLEHALSSITTYWQFGFGLILIAVVLFARGGIDGMLRGGLPWRRGGGR